MEHGLRGKNDGWQQRRDAAIRLRTTCTDCGREGLRVLPKSRGRGSAPERCECGGTGMGVKEIAAVIGVSRSSVSQYVIDPDRSSARERKQKYKGTCIDCQGPTDNRGVYRCQWCVGGEISPHRRATSPTGFAERRSLVCGVPDCAAPKRDGGHVCEPCHDAGPYAAVRAALDSENKAISRRAMTRGTRLRKRASGALGSVALADLGSGGYDGDPALAFAA